MDNIKKFEDFLDRMQGLLNNAKKQGHIIVRVEDLENTFPELKESEDEDNKRISKEISRFLKQNNGWNNEWLTWLKKQGEQKPAKNIVEIWKDMRLEVYQQASGNRHEPNYSDDSTKMFSLNDIDEIIEKMSEQKLGMKKKFEKQGNQKPADYENATIKQKDFASQEVIPRYSIGDVLCDKLCTTLNKDAQPNFEIVDIRNGLYICDKGSFPISQQDEYELVAKKIEQKPA